MENENRNENKIAYKDKIINTIYSKNLKFFKIMENAIKFLKEKGVFIDDVNDVRSAMHYEFAELMDEYALKCIEEFMEGYHLADKYFGYDNETE